MNLDLFKDLIKSTKENDIVQNFVKELGECLENKLSDNERNQIPLVQKILDGRILTTRYRDEINIKRNRSQMRDLFLFIFIISNYKS